MLFEDAIFRQLAAMQEQGFEFPWACLVCAHVNATSVGACDMCKTRNENYNSVFAALEVSKDVFQSDAIQDHLLMVLARTKGTREVEGCFALCEAMRCEKEDRFEDGVRHYKRAYLLWPELDSALHSDGVPASLRAEADALTRPIDDDTALALATRCWPKLVTIGMTSTGEVVGAQSHCIQRLWTGMGHILKITVDCSMGLQCKFIVKVIKPENCTVCHTLDHESYYVEANFYDKGHSQQLCSVGATCPRALHTDRGEDGQLTICMTELPGKDCRRLSTVQTLASLSWLARLHALYWGAGRADVAVSTGLHAQGCYWCLDSRRSELETMMQEGLKGRLRLAAVGIDARLKADCMQTICHGDAKGANMHFDTDGNVGFLDFQWVGKASAAKDLAYCLICGRPEDLTCDTEVEYLQHYHSELLALLKAKGETPPSLKQLRDSYMLAVCDLARFQCSAGWWGNLSVLQGHSDTFLSKLDGGSVLPSAEAYQDAIFDAFPVLG